MAERNAFLESFLSCHVCSETFKDPVTLKCNHNFCSSCLQELWKQAQSKKCPICRKKSSKKNTRLNFSLKELADSFAGRPKPGPSETEEQVMEVCEKHPGEVKLFCKDEQRPVCPVCEFSQHQSHKVVSVEEAVRDLKEELKSDIKSLTDKKNECRRVEEKFKLVIQHFEKQQLSAERQIRAEFNKLHQFLKEEEESRVSALREEEEQKRKTVGRAMKKIQEQMSSLSESIAAVEAELQKNEEAFLCTYKGVQNRARTQSSLTEPQLLSGALIDVAKHVGNLSFRVWEKMREKVHFHPVLLDPNTANRWLLLSEDLTSVRNGETSQHPPDNPERNLKYSNVFGSEGFSSGRHSWEVEVGDHPHWNIGVANESVNRKEECSASPKYGIWCLVHRDGKYTNGDGEFLAVTTSLQKIRVQLDYDGGEVTFSNSADMTNIYTHRHTFTQKLLPYFCAGKSRDPKTSQLQICPID
ncbi:nuclear factor 7, brain-like [Oryzias melastigma]|uniref:nuclear factor 7, brain-like n=1 Tax=Oryzias melastigma TaxID=30732 RepID=UPI000CF80214|nr:nuclear factor 7, brain-like [Oryzias melastigma]